MSAEARLPELPAGQEWRRAADLKAGDVLNRAWDDELGLVTLTVTDVELKPKTAWVRVVGTSSNYPVIHREQLRPRLDTYFTVHTAEAGR